MLSKLICHEWKETWRIPVLSCIVILIVTLVSVICFTRMEPPADESAINMGAFALMMSCSFLFSSITLVFCLYFAVRFYRNLYTDEGYLMHTLPVAPRQLIISKLLISGFWYTVISLLAVWAIFTIIFGFALPVLTSEDLSLTMTWLVNNCKQLVGMSLPAFLVYLLISTPIGAISSVLIIYAAISLGQLFSKHKVMASVLCYIGFTLLMQTVTSFAMTPYLTKMVITADTSGNGSGIPDFMGGFMLTMLLVSLLASILTAVASYLLTEYIMKKQLNLD